MAPVAQTAGPVAKLRSVRYDGFSQIGYSLRNALP
jgi:hypothetical protein